MKTLLLLVLAAMPLRAEPLRRIAVLVGANRGAPGRPELRYSYSDADQMASVLTQLGQFDADDVHVLRDPAPDEVLGELDRDLVLLQKSGGESMLVFYYSGHADASALYPRGEKLPFSLLRERLDSQAASVRIGIIDSCSGGGWTGTKGLHPSEPFVVDVPLQLTSEGSVLIASSSGLESAHESESVYGSFFTHHFVAALRGAAQQRGEGVVNLNAAFDYAKERTIRDSAALTEPQHPSFSMNLRGRADLPITRLAQSKTLLEVNETEGPLQLIHLGTGLVVMEVPAGKRVLKLSVPSGHYLVRRQRDSGNYSREVVVAPDEQSAIGEDDLQLSPFPREGGKVFKSGVDGWPLGLNDRPLTLRAGMAELTLGFLNDSTDAGVSTVSTWALAPAIRYGVTDRLTLSLAAPGGYCVGSNCSAVVSNLNAQALYLVVSQPVELAFLAAAGDNPGSVFPISLGFTARVGGGRPLSLQISGQLNRQFNDARPASNFGYTASAKLVLQLGDRLAFDAGLLIRHEFAARDYFAEGPFTFGITLAVNRHLDLRLQGVEVDAATTAPTDGRPPLTNLEQYGLLLTYRP